jgi:hypothetical protein
MVCFGVQKVNAHQHPQGGRQDREAVNDIFRDPFEVQGNALIDREAGVLSAIRKLGLNQLSRNLKYR